MLDEYIINLLDNVSFKLVNIETDFQYIITRNVNNNQINKCEII